MSIKYDKYMPLYAYLSPASIPQIVAHIQDYLVKHPILSVETIAEIIVQSLQEHPELINGTAIPISADSEQSIKAYIDSLPSIDTYTKAEINTLLTGKQDTLTFDQAPTPGSSNPVTSSGIIAAMSAMNEALETLINAKADSVSTYTKTQVDTLLTDKADTDDVYSKNTMDAMLLEYATSDSVYSKTDINTMKQVNKANLAIVSTDGIAPLDIAAGQYVYFNDVMYMATEEILTGVQLVPNANIVINPIGVTNRIGDGLKNAVTQINGLAETVSNQSQQIGNVTLPTTAQTLTGAIKENSDKISDLGPINNLTSDSTTAALSAAQGKALNQTVSNQSQQIDTLEDGLNDFETGLNVSNITRVSSLNIGTPYNNYGGVFYRKIGCFVIVHIGIEGVTENVRNIIFTLPESYRPLASFSFACGAGDKTTRALCTIHGRGDVEVISDDGYANGEIIFVAKQ